MKSAVRILLWLFIALLGAGAYLTLALHRREHINSVYLLVAAFCTYAIGYRFYSKWIAARVLALNDRRATPCEVHEDGKDFVKTNKWIVFGHHFAAISGPGPLVGPVLAAQFGYLPGTLWILIGATLGGAVQDFVILFCSIRRDGKSLGQMVKDELNSLAGAIGTLAILAILVVLLAVLALVVVNALADSPWGVFTVGATIPIALFMGGYLRFIRAGKVLEISIIGVALLLLAVWGGQYVHGHEALRHFFKIRAEPLAWSIIAYGLLASILPVWLLLAPRDYLSTFMKLGTICALALGVLFVLPDLQMPALSRFVDGSGPVVPGKIFPFCFITIACGAVSGFHSLISSGITPKIITRESFARTVGYGAMCLESFVAIMAMIAACTLDSGVYLAMNIKGAPAQIVTTVNATGFTVDPAMMENLARSVGEDSLYGRTGGAATLAVGMAHIFSRVTHGRWLDLWYHFAIMFEALFILTTLDAGTRVGRYLLQDALGHVWKPLGDTRAMSANLFASALMVLAWGAFLIMGVRDPEGGVKALWPLFGIANQLLASIALCLATTILLKMLLRRFAENSAQRGARNFALLLVVFIPLLWLIAVTGTASVQKIFHANPKIGFLAAARVMEAKLPTLEQAFATAQKSGDANAIAVAGKALRDTRTTIFNSRVDAAATMIFLALVATVILLSVREWLLLFWNRKPAKLRESEPVFLPPNEAMTSARPASLLSWFALAFALLRELSGETAIEREQSLMCQCSKPEKAPQEAYLVFTTRRFGSGKVNRCC